MPQTIEYYLSKGFDLPTATYYANGKRKIMHVTPNNDYSLIIEFDNGESRLLNLIDSITTGKALKPLQNLSVFKRVYLDEHHVISWDIDPSIDSNIIWNNKIDLCPDSCYIDSQPIK